jgi:hypothetical protein
MPITPNYGWTTPVVNGDFGAWGGILNTAFNEVDADVRALADSVATLSASAARTDVANTFSATQNFASLVASGNATIGGSVAAAGTVSGTGLAVLTSTMPNEIRSQSARFSGGPSGLGLAVFVQPSGDTPTRFTQLVSGDSDSMLRTLALRGSRVFLGANSVPAFVGSESVSVEGQLAIQNGASNLRMGPGTADHSFLEFFARSATPTTRSGFIGFGTAGTTNLTVRNDVGEVSLVGPVHTVTLSNSSLSSSVGIAAPSFNGSGSGLTGVPQSAVTALVSDLANKSNVGHTHAQSDIVGLVSALAGKSDVGHTHDASAIVSGLLPWTRLANPFRIDFQPGATEAFQFASPMIQTPGGVAAPALNRPGARTSYNWTWVNIAPVGANQESWIPVLSGVNI